MNSFLIKSFFFSFSFSPFVAVGSVGGWGVQAEENGGGVRGKAGKV